MDPQTRKTIPSGIQPIDRLMGGLDSGQLYLAYGEASGTSLSGITFLIEGLKRGEHVALVVSCSPEDAVRRFAGVGYDCLEDVLGGRLVILEYTDDLVEQIARPGQLTPALREIEWLLGETRPRRLVFDPITSVVAGEYTQLETRVAEFAQWTKSLGATALLIAHAGNAEVTSLLKPHVAESFRFEAREAANRPTEFIVFEKALTLPDQAIEVDPSRGVFLSDRAKAPSLSGAPFSAPRPDFRLVDFDSPPPQQQEQERETISGLEARTQNSGRDYTVARVNETVQFELDLAGIDEALARLVEIKDRAAAAGPPASEASPPLQQRHTDARAEERSDTAEFDLASELLGEVEILPDDPGASQSIIRQSGEARPPATESSEQSSPLLPRPTSEARTASASTPLDAGSSQGRRAETAAFASSPRRTGKRASDVRLNAAMAARAVETLLGEEKTQKTPPASAPVGAPDHAPPAQESVDPKRFKVLLIDDESESSEMIVQSLSDFTIEKIHDGVSGLARLLSHKPDLVVLDLDLNAIDGFKLLAHIRARLTVPVIIVSSKLVRSSEDLAAPEPAAETNAGVNQLSKTLAASGYYHLTTEFSTKALTQKARQLIARYRGIDSWITSLSAQSTNRPPSTTASESTAEAQHSTAAACNDRFTTYDQFVVEVEKRVKEVIDNGSALSIVGCRVRQMTTADGDNTHSRLRDVVRGVVRDTDLASTNAPGDVVILLADARATGARAFAIRLRQTVAQKLNQEPSVWMRSFPGLEEASQATGFSASPTNGGRHRRRATD
ncbi:MAG: ATPase domain-containing protein [Blastocatellia bacterium]